MIYHAGAGRNEALYLGHKRCIVNALIYITLFLKKLSLAVLNCVTHNCILQRFYVILKKVLPDIYLRYNTHQSLGFV